jgi:molybdenum cofactor cytidylyltransferase
MTEPVGLLLAAGSASRFGTDKLLHTLPDGIAIGIAAATALIQAMPNSIAVVKPGDHILINAVSKLGMRVVENPLAAQGMGTSVSAGVNATIDATGWLIALADMPWIKPATISALAERLRNGASMVAPVHKNQRGHPAGFSSRWREQLRSLSGDKGARDLIAKYSDELELLITEDAGVLQDIDYLSDIKS